jgi:hypothetical protein
LPDPSQCSSLERSVGRSGDRAEADAGAHGGLIMPNPIRPIVFDPQVVDEPIKNVFDLEARLSRAEPRGTRKSQKKQRQTTLWSAATLHDHLKNVLRQVDKNLRDEQVPTEEKFSTYVQRLCAQLQDFLAGAPKRECNRLQPILEDNFGFWDFARADFAGPVTPEQLRAALESVMRHWPEEGSRRAPADAGHDAHA